MEDLRPRHGRERFHPNHSKEKLNTKVEVEIDKLGRMKKEEGKKSSKKPTIKIEALKTLVSMSPKLPDKIIVDTITNEIGDNLRGDGTLCVETQAPAHLGVREEGNTWSVPPLRVGVRKLKRQGQGQKQRRKMREISERRPRASKTQRPKRYK